MAGAPAGGRTRPPLGGHTQALQELCSTGTQSKEKTHPGPQQGGPASPDDRGSTQRPAKRQRSAGGTPGSGRAKRSKIAVPPSYPKLLGRASGWPLWARVIRRFRSPKKTIAIFNEMSVGLWMGSLKRASPPGS